jgi:hypothetical protein
MGIRVEYNEKKNKLYKTDKIITTGLKEAVFIIRSSINKAETYYKL